jgi:hypothetical protein
MCLGLIIATGVSGGAWYPALAVATLPLSMTGVFYVLIFSLALPGVALAGTGWEVALFGLGYALIAYLNYLICRPLADAMLRRLR